MTATIQTEAAGQRVYDSSATRRLEGVDLLRGLAIFFVLMNHVNMRLRIAKIPYTQGLPEHLVNFLFWNGEEGVRIFFAISGFLITSTTLKRWRGLENVSPRQFYLLRFARIAPLLLLLLSVLCALHLAGLSDFVVKAKTGGLGRALVAALTFHVNWLEASRGYLPANWDILWSLSVEEVFYFAFPVLCLMFGRGKWLIGLLAAFVVMGPFGRTLWAHNETWKEYSYLGGMDAIALGCLTAIFTRSRKYSPRVLRGLTMIGLATVVSCLGCSTEVWKHALQRNGLYMTMLAVGTCMLIAVASQSGWRSPGWLRPMAVMGERSYEIYLTHMFVVFAFFDWYVAKGKPLGMVLWLFVATVIASSVLGAVVAQVYSEPMNAAIRRRVGR